MVHVNLPQMSLNSHQTHQMEKPEVANWFSIFFRQLLTMTERYAKVKMRDSTGVAVLALQPPFLALVMTIVFINEAEVDGT